MYFFLLSDKLYSHNFHIKKTVRISFRINNYRNNIYAVKESKDKRNITLHKTKLLGEMISFIILKIIELVMI